MNYTCVGCGIVFSSKNRKSFHNLKCYQSSPQFAANQARNLAKLQEVNRARRPPQTFVECGWSGCKNPVRVKSSANKQFCCRLHWRLGMAERFDRHMANPETIALPQSYDEFLSGDTINCIFDGCGWSGKSLGMHSNMAHGVRASDLKRLGGFNKKTGLVSATFFQALSDRENVGVAMTEWQASNRDKLKALIKASVRRTRGDMRLEGKEHRNKARHFTKKNCVKCNAEFVDGTLTDRQKYCSACRWIVQRDKTKEKDVKKAALIIKQRENKYFCRVCGENIPPCGVGTQLKTCLKCGGGTPAAWKNNYSAKRAAARLEARLKKSVCRTCGEYVASSKHGTPRQFCDAHYPWQKRRPYNKS